MAKRKKDDQVKKALVEAIKRDKGIVQHLLGSGKVVSVDIKPSPKRKGGGGGGGRRKK